MVLKMIILKSKLWFFLIIMGFISSCSVSKKIQKNLEKDGITNNFYQGLVVYDPESGQDIISINGNKYFTPASNVKLFTFYTAWKTLKDSVASYEFAQNKDSIFIRGKADPGFLNDTLTGSSLDFLKAPDKKVFLVDVGIDDPVYGSGWSWDDFAYAYMPEKSRFPIYGNTVRFSSDSTGFNVSPEFFRSKVQSQHAHFARDKEANLFYLDSTQNNFNKEIPFQTSNQLVADLLTNELGKKVTLVADKAMDFKPVYRTSYDSLYTKLLQDSDNFIAEQLMLIVGAQVSDSYSVKKAIVFSLDNYLSDITQKPRWVDGSGLSRYNLFTPSSIVYLLKKMYNEIPNEQLFTYFPKGGQSGTLKSAYSGMSYLIAKSGTLSNNHNLSGYLITQKGKVLIFSYMNNHYQGSSISRKQEMEVVFKQLHEKYK